LRILLRVWKKSKAKGFSLKFHIEHKPIRSKSSGKPV